MFRKISSLLRILGILMFALFSIQNELSANTTLTREQTDLVAKAAAEYLNSFSSYDEVISHFGKFLPSEDIDRIRHGMSQLGVDLKQPMPSFESAGATIKPLGSQISVKILPDFTLMVGSRHYQHKARNPIETFERVVKDLSPKTTFVFPSLINDAQAFDFPAGIVASAAGAISVMPVATAMEFVAMGVGLVSEGGATVVGLIGAPIVALGAAVWIGKEVYESLLDGGVQCKGSQFVGRKKVRKWKFPTSVTPTLDLAVVRSILRKPDLTGCTEESARQLEIAIKNQTVRARAFGSDSNPGKNSKSDSAR